MGYKLRRWLRDRLPDNCTSGERLVALEVADQVNDDTRVGWPEMPDIARWVGFKSVKSVGQALRGLADRGWELRVPVGKDKHGQPVFAYEGCRTTFRIPDEGEVPQPTDLSPEVRSPTPRGPLVEAETPERSVGQGQEVRPPTDPSPQGFLTEDPQVSPQRSSAVDVRLTEYGVAESERDAFIRWIKNKHNVQRPDGWIVTAARNCTLGDRITEWRATPPDPIRTNANPYAGPTDTKPSVPDPCGHGNTDGRCNPCVAARMYAELHGKHPGYLPAPLQAAWEAIAAADVAP